MKPMYIYSVSAVNSRQSLQVRVDRCDVDGRRVMATEPDYKLAIPDAGLRRRMSRIVRMGVATALDCLDGADKDKIEGIITATGLGCLGDTEKFMDSILDNEERLLNPTAFIQSTFNTIGAQIALLCGNHHYNMTYVHRGFSFESALLDAQLMFAEGEAGQLLVGAVDESTETGSRVMERMGFGRNVPAGEGAHFFVVGACPLENSLGIIRRTDTFRGPLTEEERRQKILSFLSDQGVSLEEVDICLNGAVGQLKLFSPDAQISFKLYCGEYPTASAFGLWLGIQLLHGQFPEAGLTGKVRKILIYNSYCGVNHTLMLLEKMG